MAKKQVKKKTKPKKATVVANISAGEAIYLGNSARRDLEEAREAYARADAWARDLEGRAYGTQPGVKKGLRRRVD